MKIDPYNHKRKYLNWKSNPRKNMFDISQTNQDLIIRYVEDMEKGINVSKVTVKGPRGYPRLNTIRGRLVFFARLFEKTHGLEDITKISEEQLISFFYEMKTGSIKKGDGKDYMSVDTYVNIFKAFWHWYQKVSKKNGLEVPDITCDLDTKKEKPKWVYLDEEQIKRLCENSKFKYKVLMMFLFDSGIRAPTELINIRVSDLYNDCKELHIRDEISKTFGRRIKLMVCTDLLKDYIKSENLKGDDCVFDISPVVTNKYIKRLAQRILGDGPSLAGENFSNLTMYDFRHVSCCYWLPRYKSESALKYRFGWKKSDKIHYYSELLGMKDTISDEDMLVDVTKTEIEKKLERSEKEKEIMQERMIQMEEQMQKILKFVNKLDNITVLN